MSIKKACRCRHILYFFVFLGLSYLIISRFAPFSVFFTSRISCSNSRLSGAIPLFFIIIFRTSCPTCDAVFCNALNPRPLGRGGCQTIHLYRSDVFDWVDKDFTNAHILLTVYGAESTHPSIIPQNAYYRGYLAKDFPRPIINVIVREKFGLMKRMHLSCANLVVYGIHFKINNTAQNDKGFLSGHFAGIFNTQSGDTQLWGVILELTSGTKTLSGVGSYRTDSLTRCKSLTLQHCSIPVSLDFYKKNGSASVSETLCYGPLGPSLAVVTHEPDNKIDGYGAFPDRETFSDNDVIKNLTVETACSAINYDRSTKSLFGFSVNWDIFK